MKYLVTDIGEAEIILDESTQPLTIKTLTFKIDDEVQCVNKAWIR